jgi:hypothetical protein
LFITESGDNPNPALVTHCTLQSFDPREGPSPIAADPSKELTRPPVNFENQTWWQKNGPDPLAPSVYDTWRFTHSCSYAYDPIAGYKLREDCKRGRQAYIAASPTEPLTECYQYNPQDVLTPEARESR